MGKVGKLAVLASCLGQRGVPSQPLVTWPGRAATALGTSILLGGHGLLPVLDALRVFSGAWWRHDPSGQTEAMPPPMGFPCQGAPALHTAVTHARRLASCLHAGQP